MKIAILSITDKGEELSNKIKEFLLEDPTIIKIDTFHKNINQNINNIFNSYDAIIGIMATGILIRSIANKIQNKTTDPAILSLDENGKYVISLLSGHLGRANELSQKIADLIDGEPVITTATDTNNKIGIDTLANTYYWEIINKENILIFNKAILEENKVKLYINTTKNNKINYIDHIKHLVKEKNNNTLEIIDLKNEKIAIKNLENELNSNKSIENELKSNKNTKNNINNLNNFNIIATYNNNPMFFKEKNMVLGIGARADISKEKVLNAIKIATNNLNIPIERINTIATAEIKANETGILEAVKEINKPLNIVAIDEIKNFNNDDISHSKFVNEKFNIPGVCEPAALITAKDKNCTNPKLIHKKIAIDGVTVAIAISN